jgi:hypothetical protein
MPCLTLHRLDNRVLTLPNTGQPHAACTAASSHKAGVCLQGHCVTNDSFTHPSTQTVHGHKIGRAKQTEDRGTQHHVTLTEQLLHTDILCWPMSVRAQLTSRHCMSTSAASSPRRLLVAASQAGGWKSSGQGAPAWISSGTAAQWRCSSAYKMRLELPEVASAITWVELRSVLTVSAPVCRAAATRRAGVVRRRGWLQEPQLALELLATARCMCYVYTAPNFNGKAGI